MKHANTMSTITLMVMKNKFAFQLMQKRSNRFNSHTSPNSSGPSLLARSPHQKLHDTGQVNQHLISIGSGQSLFEVPSQASGPAALERLHSRFASNRFRLLSCRSTSIVGFGNTGPLSATE